MEGMKALSSRTLVLMVTYGVASASMLVVNKVRFGESESGCWCEFVFEVVFEGCCKLLLRAAHACAQVVAVRVQVCKTRQARDGCRGMWLTGAYPF